MDEDTKLVIDVPGALLLDEEMVTQAIEEVGIKAEVVEDELTRVIGDELTQVTGGGLKEVIGEEFESELVVDEDWTEVTHEVDTQVIEEVPLDADSLVEADTGRGHMVLELTAGGQDEDSEGVSLVPVNTEDAEDVTYATLHPDYEEVNEDSADAECQIRIRDFREFCDAEVEDLENGGEGEQEAGTQDETQNLPFPCNLCPQKFKKKLFLNNHMEKRHGIKFVFTERGKKVKLIRMPEELTAGEKLDPCVEALMQQNGQNASHVLGVQSIDQRRRAEEFPSAHEVDPCDLLQGKSERDFGAGILIKTLETLAMKTAEERKETPFVVYRPLRSKRFYLLSIQTLNETTQLLLPATENDLVAANGVEKEPSFHFSHRQPSNALHNSESAALGREVIRKACTQFSHVAIVASAEQMLAVDENQPTRQLRIQILPPPSPPPSVSIIKFEHFARTIIQCQPKRLRCLSFPPQPIARPASDEVEPTRPKRKYTRRHERNAKRAKKEKGGRKRRRVETSDEESDFEVELDTSSSDEEDSRPRLARLLSPPSESERVLTPPRNCHPAELEVLEPPKKKFSRRGRPPKSPRSGLSTSLKKMKLQVDGGGSDDGNPENAETLLSPPPHRRPFRKRTPLQELDVDHDRDDEGNDGDGESEGQDKSMLTSSKLPLKKRGRGRPRKYPIQA